MGVFHSFIMANQAYAEDAFGTLGRELRSKIRNDNDAKVIIVGKNAGTGLGKTTLAIHLCRFIDSEWNPRENGAYWDPIEYEDDYNNHNIPAGSAVLLDEIEVQADSRRAMSHENVKFSQAWSRLRNRNVINIVTCPSMAFVDNRLEMLADYWVLVESRGVAKPHRININDFKPNKIQKDPFDGEERIFWDKIPKSDPDYDYVEEMKSNMRSQAETIKMQEHERRVEKAIEEAKREFRNEIIKGLNDHTELSQTQIADMPFVELDQSMVNKVVNAAD